MPTRPPSRCTVCRRLHPGTGKCPDCLAGVRAASDRARGTTTERGYDTAGHRRRFRPGVLQRDPVCVLCHSAASTVADHWPLSRRQLLARGMDADDPANGRGLCSRCHNRQTAVHQPGGWQQSSKGQV